MKYQLLGICLLLPASAMGQLIFQPLRVHPENVAAGDAFLVSVEDSWTNGCGGDVSFSVSPERIEIVATSAPDSAGIACTQAFEPFVDLLNPRQELPSEIAGEFAETVDLEYIFVDPFGERQSRSQLTLEFTSVSPPQARVETGSWVTPTLQSSGLFVDQQHGIFSVSLADYANGSGAWFYGSGAVSGNVVITEIARFANVACVTTPCPRAAPVASGTLLAVLENQNSLLVKYQDLLDEGTGAAAAFRYSRFDLPRGAGSTGVPDLAGPWIIGISPGQEGLPASEYAGFDLVVQDTMPQGGLITTTFAARDVNRLDDSSQPDFLIQCQDARPVDGGLECRTVDFTLGEDCLGFFEFADAGLQRVQGGVDCGSDRGELVMIRR